MENENHYLFPMSKLGGREFEFPPDPENGYEYGFLGLDQSPDLCKFSPISNVSSEVEFVDDHENYPMINYINQILMEENLVQPDPLALQAAEKSFYEVLTTNFDPSPSPSPSPSPLVQQEISSCSSLLKDSELISNMCTDAETMLQFRRGLEEGSKFLPNSDYKVFVEMPKRALPSKSKRNVTAGNDDSNHRRSNKLSAVYQEEAVELSEMFDRVLLYGDLEVLISSSSGLIRDEKKGRNKKVEAVDLVSLLLSCAQSIDMGDRINAIEQLKQIRQHASPNGDPYQRLGFTFANALEARLRGTGPDLYAAHLSKKVSAAEELKAMRVYLCAPFKQMSSFLANMMILDAASKATTLHIVDFGISYGFHWPSFIHLLSKRNGGPPKLRITGIDTPLAGFKPEEKLEDTGRRLARYCERFGVPFEYKGLAIKNWETIKVEELNLTRHEVVAVNCQTALMNLHHETTGISPRDAVLSKIREMRPDILINNSINGSFGSFFFLSRFKEALLFYTTIFDSLDVLLPRDDLQRMKFEQNFLGLEVLNVVACEGPARVDRRETYKYWHARYIRAGFKILPLNPNHIKELKKKTKEGYHKDFMLCEDDDWMLLGWKGKVLQSSSCWVPA